nr:DegT/DnrJ/EryC1/StrS family aminotransferase [uncultured Schaedlerella sp.]
MGDQKIFVTRSSMPPYEEYIEAIKPLWDSHWLTNMGVYHQKLESQLKKYLDVPGLSLIVNGHMALELAIQVMGFPKGGEVITTPFTFISTTHAIIRNGLNPVFCDVKKEDGTIDETKIEELITEKTVAIIPVHVYGNICNVEEIQQIADKYGLKVIYDAAHAFGVSYKGKGIGSYGDASIFSFHATKVFNTIEGGAVAFTEPKYYDKLYNLKNFGIRGEELVTEVGANAKMNEFSAIMGLCNLKYVERSIARRKEICEDYEKKLCGINGIRLFEKKTDVEKNYGYFPILVEKEYPINRDELYELLKENGIYTRKYFYPLSSDQVCFKNKYRNVELVCAREMAKQVLVLPVYETLEIEIIEKIIEIIDNK